MASNEKVLIKRIIETVMVEEWFNLPVSKTSKFYNPKAPFVRQKRLVPKLVYNFGFYQATSHGGRQLVAVVEGSYEDAVLARTSPRTESGNTIKGFKKLKDKSE